MFAVLKYIHENIRTNLELTDVAKHFGYSKWYFCAKFREYTKTSYYNIFGQESRAASPASFRLMPKL